MTKLYLSIIFLSLLQEECFEAEAGMVLDDVNEVIFNYGTEDTVFDHGTEEMIVDNSAEDIIVDNGAEEIIVDNGTEQIIVDNATGGTSSPDRAIPFFVGPEHINVGVSISLNSKILFFSRRLKVLFYCY